MEKVLGICMPIVIKFKKWSAKLVSSWEWIDEMHTNNIDYLQEIDAHTEACAAAQKITQLGKTPISEVLISCNGMPSMSYWKFGSVQLIITAWDGRSESG
jgi:hypothetical protein